VGERLAVKPPTAVDNPARPAWALLSVGLLSSFVGQLSLAPYQLLGKD
jgi:hypothetical protein